MLSGLRQSVVRTRLVPKRGFSTSRVVANQDVGTSSQEPAFDGIVDRETLLPSVTPQAVVPTPAPVRRAVPPGSQPPILIPPQYDPLLELLAGAILRTGKKRHEAGKKQAGRKIVTDTLLHIHTLTRAAPLPILRKAIENVAPTVRNVVHSLPAKRIIYPQPLSEKQRTHKAIDWILQASQSRSGWTLAHRLAQEIIAVVEGAGKENMQEISPAYRMKEEVHKVAVMNRGNVLKAR
ncbi:hypothetical protein FOMPIDRAFT_160035 [Fomitopsis schrenkii]|uniref:Small ribosomal subunit protein uS7 domain-containing protein n=1 Tax=Fomitopsis schrenkii TaxID=2126942 RepID=S8DWR2_FOMSC|nr:hypothetical protein FOMPIDRAFT_160035 [Fomitopsis schrenkii]